MIITYFLLIVSAFAKESNKKQQSNDCGYLFPLVLFGLIILYIEKTKDDIKTIVKKELYQETYADEQYYSGAEADSELESDSEEEPEVQEEPEVKPVRRRRKQIA